MFDRSQEASFICWESIADNRSRFSAISSFLFADNSNIENTLVGFRISFNPFYSTLASLSLSLSVFYEKVKMYNSLPANIKQSDRLKTFKHKLKESIPSRIKYI